MADKIKSFFQKKKTSAKFMKAGKGYKLTDSTSTICTASESKEPVKRAEPTAEAKIAGQAALARLEAKKNDKPRFNTSYAAIQARVKRELELERKAQQNLQQTENTSLKEKKDRVEDPSIFAVIDVFFRCPYLSDEVLLRDEWKKKIREFLYEQVKGEEAGLTACLIIQNCNTGKEKIESCVETLGKYLDNIINNPDVEKYWKIRMYFGITTGRQEGQYPCAFVFNSNETRNGTFASPNYPGLYPRSTECHYFFNGQLNERVHLHFHFFDVEGVLPCEAVSASDYVEFSNYMIRDRKYKRHCGQMKEFDIYSDRKFFRVTFKSNDRLDATGFNASYVFLDEEENYTIKIPVSNGSAWHGVALPTLFLLLLLLTGHLLAGSDRDSH